MCEDKVWLVGRTVTMIVDVLSVCSLLRAVHSIEIAQLILIE